MGQTQYSILIVDDDPVNREMLARRLEREAYLITLAEDGRQALDLMGMERFDLVLLDIQMPGMDGFEVLHTIQSDPILKRTAVIMTTALNDRESVLRSIRRGAVDYLVKPFDMPQVKARIQRCLHTRRHAIQAADMHDLAALDAAVLIVEDNILNLELLARRIRKLGCTVTETRHAEDALSLLEQHDYDLILLDIQMPGMSGIELLRRIKYTSRHRHTPVIMVSAEDDSNTMIYCYELGATDYMRKPVNLPLLQARVLTSIQAKKTDALRRKELDKI